MAALCGMPTTQYSARSGPLYLCISCLLPAFDDAWCHVPATAVSRLVHYPIDVKKTFFYVFSINITYFTIFKNALFCQGFHIFILIIITPNMAAQDTNTIIIIKRIYTRRHTHTTRA